MALGRLPLLTGVLPCAHAGHRVFGAVANVGVSP